jgi:hypothetical protein
MFKKTFSESRVSFIMNALVVFFIGVALLSLGGCSIFTLEPVKIDPAYNKAVVYNDSPYVVQLEGLFEKHLRPGEVARTNLGCYGRFKVLATAYRILGTQAGNEVLEYYGQREFTIRIDGKNRVYREESTDSYYVFRSYSFYPSTRGRKYYVRGSNPCSVLTPTINIKFGR